MQQPPKLSTFHTETGYTHAPEERIGARYKTATICNRRMYIGNVMSTLHYGNQQLKANIYPDRVLKSLPDRFWPTKIF